MNAILMILDFMIRLSWVWLPLVICCVIFAIYEPNHKKINDKIIKLLIDKQTKQAL